MNSFFKAYSTVQELTFSFSILFGSVKQLVKYLHVVDHLVRIETMDLDI